MKKIICLILAGIAINCAKAQLVEHEWKAILKVVDETGQPVASAQTWVSFYVAANKGDKISGLTDTNGIFSASHRDKTYYLGFRSEKKGYYSFQSEYELGFQSGYNFTKWNPTQTIVLRKIGNPIPMYARREESGMELQKEDEPMSFDLMAGDWVAPFGIGSKTDIFFTVHRKIINDREYDCTLKVSFPNKEDGIVAAPSTPCAGSEFQTSRTAAENGYESELDLHYSNTNRPAPVFGYFIRVRTELDENGNVKSALYGKISGDFKFYAGTVKPHSGMGFDYYLNPTPNDRNLEFDPKHNLSTNLKLLEGVNAP